MQISSVIYSGCNCYFLKCARTFPVIPKQMDVWLWGHLLAPRSAWLIQILHDSEGRELQPEASHRHSRGKLLSLRFIVQQTTSDSIIGRLSTDTDVSGIVWKDLAAVWCRCQSMPPLSGLTSCETWPGQNLVNGSNAGWIRLWNRWKQLTSELCHRVSNLYLLVFLSYSLCSHSSSQTKSPTYIYLF